MKFLYPNGLEQDNKDKRQDLVTIAVAKSCLLNSGGLALFDCLSTRHHSPAPVGDNQSQIGTLWKIAVYRSVARRWIRIDCQVKS